MTYVLIVAALVPAVALVAAAVLWRLRPSTRPLLIVAIVLAAAYTVANVLIAIDYDDADGFMDCWPDCSGVQEAIRTALFIGGTLLLLVAAVSLVWAVIAALRSSREPSSRA
jgi:heme/copper-type cytochrome/quinol oxidase subunit 3